LGSGMSDQSQQDWPDADADAALMAAEEQDLLGEASPLTPPTGTAAAATGGAVDGADAASGGCQGGRGTRGVHQDLFVSLRLERQGLTDKQVRCLARAMHWASPMPASRCMGFGGVCEGVRPAHSHSSP
jgi:hypothetical protein